MKELAPEKAEATEAQVGQVPCQARRAEARQVALEGVAEAEGLGARAQELLGRRAEALAGEGLEEVVVAR